MGGEIKQVWYLKKKNKQKMFMTGAVLHMKRPAYFFIFCDWCNSYDTAPTTPKPPHHRSQITTLLLLRRRANPFTVTHPR